MINEKVKSQIKAAGVKRWQLADALGISEATMTRWMRHELTGKRKKLVINAIEKASKKKVGRE